MFFELYVRAVCHFWYFELYVYARKVRYFTWIADNVNAYLKSFRAPGSKSSYLAELHKNIWVHEQVYQDLSDICNRCIFGLCCMYTYDCQPHIQHSSWVLKCVYLEILSCKDITFRDEHSLYDRSFQTGVYTR